VDRFPKRIVCLTEEPTEVLYHIGEQHRIVGISGFTVRPPQARKEKPKVSAFLSAKVEAILALKPDLAIGFSDIQADIAKTLIGAGVNVWISNHRSVQGILDYCMQLACLVGAPARGQALIDAMQRAIDQAQHSAEQLPMRPRVYFEEWDEPRISAIQWVAEIIRIAGGQDILPQQAEASLAKDRILANDDPIIAAQPELILGSWCGKKFRPEQLCARPGYAAIPAVQNAQVFEVKSAIILQPGPAALLAGLPEIAERVKQCARGAGL
jgi:iron complex transport system substrate-binding protein